MMFLDSSLQTALAVFIERWLGYPKFLFVLFGHPVQWMGSLITYLDTQFNTTPHIKNMSRVNGLLALFLLIFAVWCVSAILHLICQAIPYGFVLNALFASTLIAQKSLRDHVKKVSVALGHSVAQGRVAVSEIVGRDTQGLDASGIVKATLESLAENTADGIVAPVFWYALFGLPGLAIYKAINTADSMIGHKSFQYRHFGWAAAKLDDLVNLPASRITALLFAGGAWFKGTRHAKAALKTAWRDAGKHRSPNAGWPEAAMAGALGLRFGGPRTYDGEFLKLPYMGDGRDHFLRTDIDVALKLYDRTLWVLCAVTIALIFVL